MKTAKRKNLAARVEFTKRNRRPAFPRAVLDEPDADWRRWFMEMTVRRHDLNRRKMAKIIVSEVEKDGKQNLVVRKRAKPEPASTWVKKEAKQFNSEKISDLQSIQELWKKSVDGEVASESEVVSFNRGVLTVEVSSASLIQELRQFHYEPLLADLREAWPAKTPLVRVKFQPGRKNGL